MKLNADRFSDLDYLTYKMQQLIVKRFVEETLYREIKLSISDNCRAAIKKVEDIFTIIHPTFLRKVELMGLDANPGEIPLDWALRIQEQAELGDLEDIRPQELMMMKFCQGFKDQDLQKKICKMKSRSWEEVKVLIWDYESSTKMQSSLVKGKGEKMHHMLSSGGRSPSPRPGRSKTKTRTGEEGMEAK